MARLLRLTRCPYCHRKISFFGAMILKTKGEYCCTRCNCISNVVIKRSIYGIASFACILAMLILVLYLSFGDHGSIWGVVYLLLPFLLLYIIIPFFVGLEPCNDKSAENRLRHRANPVPVQKHEIPKKNIHNTIELQIDDNFTKSFMSIKNTGTIKFLEDDEEKETSLKDFNDITGSFSKPKKTEKEPQVIEVSDENDKIKEEKSVKKDTEENDTDK